MDTLIHCELPFLEIVAHGLIRLHQCQRQRKRIALHGVYQVLPLRIAEHQDEDAVQSRGVVLCGEGFYGLPAGGDARKDKIGCTGE